MFFVVLDSMNQYGDCAGDALSFHAPGPPAPVELKIHVKSPEVNS
jgi:hypothetical protein